MDKHAKKISDIFADGRLDKADVNAIALGVVMQSREEEVLDRISFFCEMFDRHRNLVDLGRQRFDY
jgi:hypothetical protein